MRILSACLGLSVLLAAVGAGAQTWEDCRNAVALSTMPSVDPHAVFESSSYTGAPGQVQVYLVALNPHSWDRNAALATVGGFDLRVLLPANVFLLETTLPAGVVNELVAPEFKASGGVPVVNDQCVLATLRLGVFTLLQNFLYLAPLEEGASLPGQIAIRDGDAGGAPQVAFPVSTVFEWPVFEFWPLYRSANAAGWSASCGDVVSLDRAAFGAVKAPYR